MLYEGGYNVVLGSLHGMREVTMLYEGGHNVV